MQTIAVLTSGGDAPGMNAGIRAVVRAAVAQNMRVLGVRRGYDGLIEGDFVSLGARDVANILQRGGTMLYTARSTAFKNSDGRRQAAQQLQAAKADALAVIGGDGSMQGAHALHIEHGIQVAGIPASIDNDLYGTDYSIGYFTAVETALDALDRLRDTGASHQRTFIIEVMGRHAGHIALEVALAGGAEDVFVPEIPRAANEAAEAVMRSRARGKKNAIIVVAEGYPGGGEAIQAALEAATGHPTRLSVLGHVQRGGTPTAGDRVLASRLGAAAVSALRRGESDIMLGIKNNSITTTELPQAWQQRKHIDRAACDCLRLLSV